MNLLLEEEGELEEEMYSQARRTSGGGEAGAGEADLLTSNLAWEKEEEEEEEKELYPPKSIGAATVTQPYPLAQDSSQP